MMNPTIFYCNSKIIEFKKISKWKKVQNFVNWG